jgi:hypothetical protein
MKTLRSVLTISCAALLALVTTFGALAQSATPPAKVVPERVEVPDGSPTLPRDLSINQSTVARESDSAEDAKSREERVESRLAVIRAGRATTTDPNVGRYDRAATGGTRRVSPAMWEIFRF